MRGREWEFWIDSAKLPSPNKVVIESYERRVASEPPSHDTPETASAFDSQGCVALLSCVKSKQNAACRAEHMYTSSLFRKMLAYARTLNPKAIYILSARYGLLALDEKIEPYEKTLKSMSPHHKSDWATGVIRDLRQKCDLAHDRFVILAGEGYRKGLVSSIEHYSVPMDGLSFGQQLRWLGENTP